MTGLFSNDYTKEILLGRKREGPGNFGEAMSIYEGSVVSGYVSCLSFFALLLLTNITGNVDESKFSYKWL